MAAAWRPHAFWYLLRMFAGMRARRVAMLLKTLHGALGQPGATTSNVADTGTRYLHEAQRPDADVVFSLLFAKAGRIVSNVTSFTHCLLL